MSEGNHLNRLHNTIDSIRCLLHFLINEFEYFESTLNYSEYMIDSCLKTPNSRNKSKRFQKKKKIRRIYREKNLKIQTFMTSSMIEQMEQKISYLESVNSSLIKCNENPCKALKIRSLEKQNFKTKKINFLREKLRAKKKLLRVLSKQANEFLEELIEMKVFLSDNMEIELNIQWDENEINSKSLNEFINYTRNYIHELYRNCIENYFQENRNNNNLTFAQDKGDDFINTSIEIEKDKLINKSLIEEITNLKSIIENYEEIYAKNKNEIEKLTKKNEELKSHKDLNETIENLQARINEKQNDYERIKQIIDQDSEFIHQLETELVGKNLQIIHLENKINVLNKSQEQKDEFFKRKNQEILQHNNELENLIRIKNEQIEKLNDKMNKEIKAYLERIDSLETEKEEIFENYSNCLREIENFERKLKEKEKKTSQIQKENKSILEQLKFYKTFVNGLTNEQTVKLHSSKSTNHLGVSYKNIFKNPLEKRLFDVNYELEREKYENSRMKKEMDKLKDREREMNFKLKEIDYERMAQVSELKGKIADQSDLIEKMKQNYFNIEDKYEKLKAECNDSTLKSKLLIEEYEATIKKSNEEMEKLQMEINECRNEQRRSKQNILENPKGERASVDELYCKETCSIFSELNLLQDKIEKHLTCLQENPKNEKCILNENLIKQLEEKLLTSKLPMHSRQDKDFEEIIKKLITAIKLILNEKERNTKYHQQIIVSENIIEKLKSDIMNKEVTINGMGKEFVAIQMTLNEIMKMKENLEDELENVKLMEKKQSDQRSSSKNSSKEDSLQKGILKLEKELNIKSEENEILKMQLQIYQEKCKRLNEELNETREKLLNVRMEKNNIETEIIQLQAERRESFWQLKTLEGINQEEKTLREQIQMALLDFLSFIAENNIPIDYNETIHLRILATSSPAENP